MTWLLKIQRALLDDERAKVVIFKVFNCFLNEKIGLCFYAFASIVRIGLGGQRTFDFFSDTFDISKNR